MRRYDYFDDYDYGYHHWRPDMSDREIHATLQNARRQFAREIEAHPVDLEQAAEASRRYAQNLREGLAEDDLTGYGNYTLYLKAWFTICPESEEQHVMRLAGNHIRHRVLSYDSFLQNVKRKYWVPEELFDELWDVALQVMSAQYPQLEPSTVELKNAREHYRQFPDDEYDHIGEQVHAVYVDLLERREQQQWEAEEAARQANLAERRDWNRNRSAMCRLVSGLFKNPPDGLQVKYKARMYPCEIVKVNPVKIRVRFTLKNGQERVEDVYACYLYDDNRHVLGHVDGYEQVVSTNQDGYWY